MLSIYITDKSFLYVTGNKYICAILTFIRYELYRQRIIKNRHSKILVEKEENEKYELSGRGVKFC